MKYSSERLKLINTIIIISILLSSSSCLAKENAFESKSLFNEHQVELNIFDKSNRNLKILEYSNSSGKFSV